MQIETSKSKSQAQVLIAASDPQTVSDKLREALGAADIACVSTTCGTKAFDLFRPDVASCTLVDLLLPPSGGLDVLTKLRRKRPNAPVLIFGEAPSARAAVEAMRLGANDVLETPLDPQLLQTRILQLIAQDRHRIAAEQATRDRNSRISTLSRRERQVLDLVLQGLSNKETARVLKVSPKAIEIYRAGMMRKLGQRSSVVMATWVSQCPGCNASPLPHSPHSV